MRTSATITLEELDLMPEDGLRHEIDEGHLIEMPIPGYEHGFISANVGGLLGNYVNRSGLGTLVSGSGFILGRSPDILRGPDLAFIRSGRLKNEDGWPELGPDLVVEIVFPLDTASQIDRKVHQYLAAGTRAVWIVYPDTQSVHVFEPHGVARIVEREALLSSPTALPGFEIQVREIFE